MEEVQVESRKKPKFVIVELTQLEKLLQRCFECGNKPGGKQTGLSRSISWTQTGTNLTDHFHCECQRESTGSNRLSWSCQENIKGTETRKGNLAIVAAARVGPVEYEDLSSLFHAAQIPLMSKRQFLRLTKSYVWPTVDDAYLRQNADIFTKLSNPVQVAVDGQYDSPGFSAELCCVTAIEDSTKMVIDFSITHKSEVENVSRRMELRGVAKCIDSIEKRLNIEEITVDKHAPVCSYLKKNDYQFKYDPWHRLRSLKKDLLQTIKIMSDSNEKGLMRELSKRFIVHLHHSIERANGDTALCKELFFSFFLHVQGIHEWRQSNFIDLIPVSEGTKVSPSFKNERFRLVLECIHITEGTHPNSRHATVQPNSASYQKLLSIAAKTQFLSDLERLKFGKLTVFNESFNNVRIHWCPKRKYFRRPGFTARTQLAALEWNNLQYSEMSGERKVSEVFQQFSKARQAKVTKIKKTNAGHEWKKQVVDEVLLRKERYGKGDPLKESEESEESEDEYDAIHNELGDIFDLGDLSDDDNV